MGIAEDYQARLAAWSDIQGHLEFLHAEVCARPGATVIELGVRSGNSTSALLAACDATGGLLHSCDIAAPDVPPEWHLHPAWQFTRGDDTDPAVAAVLPAECDVLFIDTSHDYDHTLDELALYVPRLRPGGVACLHDTEWAWPSEELDGPHGTVAAALTEFCAGHGLAWENRHGSYGMGVIRIPGRVRVIRFQGRAEHINQQEEPWLSERAARRSRPRTRCRAQARSRRRRRSASTSTRSSARASGPSAGRACHPSTRGTRRAAGA